MIYTEDTIKYCLLSWDFYESNNANNYGNESLPISGLYNWANVFGGKRMYPQTPEDFSNSNIFHINITERNLQLLTTFIKKKNEFNPEAKILLNVDFSIELWKNCFNYPDLFLEQLNKADYIFAVEPLMGEILSDALQRNVPEIPHPVDIEGLKQYRNNERLNQIGYALHRYDMNYMLSDYIIKQIDNSFQSIAVGSTQNTKANMMHIYDFIKESCPFKELIKLTSQLYAVYETYTIHSYGRYTVECAALGIPCVGSKAVSSIKRCFPDLAIDTNDITKAAMLLNLLINDKGFYFDTAIKGTEKAEQYSFENSKKEMLKFLNSERH